MEITVENVPASLQGREPRKNTEAPSAPVVKTDGSGTVLGSMQIDAQLIFAVPDLAHVVSSGEGKQIQEMVQEITGLSVTLVTTEGVDACKKIAEENDMGILSIVSDEKGAFGQRFGILIGEGTFKGKLARSVFVIDKEGYFTHVEVVPEATGTPDYESAVTAARTAATAKKKGHAGGHMHDW